MGSGGSYTLLSCTCTSPRYNFYDCPTMLIILLAATVNLTTTSFGTTP